MRRVLVLSDPTRGMGALAGARVRPHRRGDRPRRGARRCRSSGCRSRAARASRWTAAPRTSTPPRASCGASSPSRRRAASIHVIVPGVNVGAQSYWDALATMLHAHARRADHDAGRVDGADRARGARGVGLASRPRTRSAIGGYERIMGPNGEAQYFARDLGDAYRDPLRALPLHLRRAGRARAARARRRADPRRARDRRRSRSRDDGRRLRDGRRDLRRRDATRAASGRSRCAR